MRAKPTGLMAGVFLLLCSTSSLLIASPLMLESQGAQLRVDDKSIELRKGRQTLLKLTDIAYNFEPVPEWQPERIGDAIVLRAQLPASVDFYRVQEDQTPRQLELRITAVEGGFRVYAAPDWGRQVTLKFAHLGDHFFGLSAPLQPDNRLSPDLTGTHISVDVNSEEAAWRENYATAYSAFFMSSFGYGSYFDSYARGHYQFAINGQNQIHHDTGTLDWYVFVGDDGVDIHRHYFALIGKPKSVPAWGLGPIGWRDQNDGGAPEIVDDMERMNQLKIPFTSWFVDRPYSDGAHAWSQMNFRADFADPQTWIKKLREQFGVEFMTWVATSTFGDARFEKHLAGEFTYLDLSHKPSVEAYQQALKNNQHSYGVKGHKIDRGDEGFPAFEKWHDGTPLAERRNKYVQLMAKIHHQALQDAFGEDQLTFARPAYQRTQPYLSGIWGGDPRTTWDGMQANFANAMRSSFMGFPVWGTDVGGYQGEGFIAEDLYLRWMQAGSMTGLFEIKLDGAGGDGRDRMPWQYDEKFQQRFRAINQDRMRFIPYLYSLANTSAQVGVMMQPMAYRHLQDKNTYAIWDQFYLGDALLVAPVFDEKLSRRVYLPKGEWRDLEAMGQVIKGGRWIQVEADLDKLPRYVKANSIYVTGNLYRGNDRLWANEPALLTIHAYPGAAGERVEFLYADLLDKGQIKSLQLVRDNKIIRFSSPALASAAELQLVMARTPKSVRLNGQVQTVNFDVEQQQLRVTLPQGETVELEIR